MKRSEPGWHKDAVIYELHVRSFFDSNRDGIGDFPGLTERLPYLKNLGVTVVWLLPFQPSPLKTQGHDITDFKAVHPHYGSLEDFKAFLDAAHRLNLRVVIDFVMNHTSIMHPWFERARRAPQGSSERDFYIWSETPDKFTDARVIYKDFETSNWAWDPVAGAYYWHRFFQHQPDLNFDNPRVHEAVFDIVDFWLALGVDGLRLKGASYLYAREGTSCENLPEVHRFLRKLRKHVDEEFPGRLLFARPKVWADDVISYFGKNDECQVGFNFPLTPRMFMSLGMEDRFPLLDVLQQMPKIPASCQWANFLRDHDDLSLDMVTDEEREYLFRTYAKAPNARVNLGIRRRLAPLLGNNRRKIELMNGLLFSLPGAPVVYYGDEIGMGDNIYLSDRNGLRTPLQWSSSRNAGFSRAPNAQTLFLPVIENPEFHYETVNIEAQEQNPHSLLAWMQQLISIRKEHPAFSQGSIEFVHPENRKVLVFVRKHEEERILVVANLSSLAQYVELDLGRYDGFTPVELFGKTPFPPIGTLPYFLTLGPHSFYWFTLNATKTGKGRGAAPDSDKVEASISLKGHEFDEHFWTAVEKALPKALQGFRWFGGKSRPIRSVQVLETISLPKGVLALLSVEHTEGAPETYALPLCLAAPAEAKKVRKLSPNAVVLEFEDGGLAYDATANAEFRDGLYRTLLSGEALAGRNGTLQSALTRKAGSAKKAGKALRSEVLKGEQSNTSINYGGRTIFKLYRRLEEGTNPDVEIGRFLTDKTRFKNSPLVIATLEYRRKDRETITVGCLQEFVRNEGDAWSVFLEKLRQAMLKAAKAKSLPLPVPASPLVGAHDVYPKKVKAELEPFLSMAELLGKRTMEMHLALASSGDREALFHDTLFEPEPFTLFYQQALYQSMRKQTDFALSALKRALPRLEGETRRQAESLLGLEDKIWSRFRRLLDHKVSALKTRTHGDFHLGQVLSASGDFIIIDYEGEPARSLSERKFKRSPLRDVGGMLRSFHYAANVAGKDESLPKEARSQTEQWLRAWHGWVCTAYLKGYLSLSRQAAFLPQDDGSMQVLLDIYLLEKALYELVYEINNRPDWVRVPLSGILEILEAST